MTREEAIKRLEEYRDMLERVMECECPSFTMAIESLSADEVVRCKDCRYRKKIGTLYYCDLDEFNVKDEDFCSWGERREP